MTAKNPKRRQELLSVAKGLFFQKGYEKTSIADVHTKAGVSKGAFYHHFASKNAILEAIVDDGIAAAVASLTEISHNNSHNAIEKIQSIIVLACRSKIAPSRDMKQLNHALQRDANALLNQKMRTKWLQVATPVLDRILQQGVDESHFSVSHTSEVSRVLLVIVSDFTDQIQRQVALEDGHAEPHHVVHTNLGILQSVLESLLGSIPGSLELQTIQPQLGQS